MDPFDALETRLGHRFRDRELLRRALTHRSWSFEQGEARNYERLELLGDAVLGLLATEWLFHRLGAPEGELSKRKAVLVSAPTLAGFARELGVGAALRLGVGEERSGGRTKENLLADSLEAILGAVYLDAGLEAVRRIVEPRLRATAESVEAGVVDGKTTLQETLQAASGEPPEYRLVAEEGPDHAKTFTMECWWGGEVLGRGSGSSKKRAEQAAAADALARLDRDGA